MGKRFYAYVQVCTRSTDDKCNVLSATGVPNESFFNSGNYETSAESRLSNCWYIKTHAPPPPHTHMHASSRTHIHTLAGNLV